MEPNFERRILMFDILVRIGVITGAQRVMAIYGMHAK
jgi:hypothetical protein